MYFRIEQKNADPISFYRNRIGVIFKTELFKKPANLFFHDAMFWNLERGNFTRNRIILGGNIDVKKWFQPQIWYVLQNDIGKAPRHQFYLFLTFKI